MRVGSNGSRGTGLTPPEFTFASKPGAAGLRWSFRGDYRSMLNLKSCEMQHPEADRLLARLMGELKPDVIWRYPYHPELVNELARSEGIPPENLLLTAGSCSAIGLIVDALGEPARRLVLQEPSFESWNYYAQLRGVRVVSCTGLSGEPPVQTLEPMAELLAVASPAVAVINNPGTPTGLLFGIDDIRAIGKIAEQYGHVLVIDECYAAFVGINHVPLTTELPNVIVVRSLSKSHALAGSRLAVVFGSTEVIRYLRRFRTDGTVSGPAVALALAMTQHAGELRAIREDVVRIRDDFAQEVLDQHPRWTALRPGANFITFATGIPGKGLEIERFLAEHRVRIRGLDEIPGLSGCLRFSIADRASMHRVVQLLGDGGSL